MTLGRFDFLGCLYRLVIGVLLSCIPGVRGTWTARCFFEPRYPKSLFLNVIDVASMILMLSCHAMSWYAERRLLYSTLLYSTHFTLGKRRQGRHTRYSFTIYHLPFTREKRYRIKCKMTINNVLAADPTAPLASHFLSFIHSLPSTSTTHSIPFRLSLFFSLSYELP